MEALIKKFGLCPAPASREAIKQLLELEIQEHDDREGCGEYLRVLCFMLFYIGRVEDSALIWKTKKLNMDTGAMIDAGLLCGAGYGQTINFIKETPALHGMKAYLETCFADDPNQFDKAKIEAGFRRYYSNRYYGDHYYGD